MSLAEQGMQPTGRLGKMIGRLMNKGHTGIYIDYVRNHMPVENAVMLDIGCGGGKFIQYITAQHPQNYAYGVDHSWEMIQLATQVNYSAIQQNRVCLSHCSVADMHYHPDTFDLITAFETIQFWPHLDQVLSKIYTFLKPGGTFLVMNRYPKEKSIWWERAQLKNQQEYKHIFKAAGFQNMTTDLAFKKNWLVALGEK